VFRSGRWNCDISMALSILTGDTRLGADMMDEVSEIVRFAKGVGRKKK